MTVRAGTTLRDLQTVPPCVAKEIAQTRSGGVGETGNPKTVLERARQETGLSVEDLWLRYVELGGTRTLLELDAYLQGLATPTTHDHDVAAQALNERYWELGRNPLMRFAADEVDTGLDGFQTSETESPTSAASFRPTVSVVIPALNEARNLPHALAGLPPDVSEVIIVDGHSTDGTAAVAATCRPDAKILVQDGKGKGNALACGFKAVTGDITVMLDADGSTDPIEVPRFVAALTEGFDVVKGSRFVRGGGSADMTFVRRVGNRLLTRVVNQLWGVRYTDLCYGYIAFWTRCLTSFFAECSGFEVETLMNIRVATSGLKVTEVPSFEAKRLHGTSNLKVGRDGTRVARTILAEIVRPV